MGTNLKLNYEKQLECLKIEIDIEKQEILRQCTISLLSVFIDNFDVKLLEIGRNKFTGAAEIMYDNKKLTDIQLRDFLIDDRNKNILPEEEMDSVTTNHYKMLHETINFNIDHRMNKSFMSCYTGTVKETSTPSKYYTPMQNTQIDYNQNSSLLNCTSIKKNLFEDKRNKGKVQYCDSEYFITKFYFSIKAEENGRKFTIAHYDDNDILAKVTTRDNSNNNVRSFENYHSKDTKSFCHSCLII